MFVDFFLSLIDLYMYVNFDEFIKDWTPSRLYVEFDLIILQVVPETLEPSLQLAAAVLAQVSIE